MSTSALVTALVDDAALFPPGNAPMAQAVPDHLAHLTSWYAPVVGPFLCPASRVPEAAAATPGPINVRIVADTGIGGISPAVDTLASDDRLRLAGVEVPLPAEAPEAAARRAVAALDAALGGPDESKPGYVEPARAPGWRAALEVLAESGYLAKLRTGGVTPDAFPHEAEVAEFVLGCLDLGVAFKCTAGLHRAVRHTADDGTEQHGFLNVILAVAAGVDGADAASVTAVLAERDKDNVSNQLRGLDERRAGSVRRWLTSFGSCIVIEPVEDLLAFGLIEK
ncbi:MAG: hypothetical protein ICV70_04165 [Jiangellaceae bacterium]|nr:hypothetical protein [Jiangellaceae bacterium]